MMKSFLKGCLIWVKAARPQTLPASISPVIAGCALAFYDGAFDWFPALLCFFIALSAQIAVNFANDYFDFKKGADRLEDRTGPARAVTSGWVTPQKMFHAAIIMCAITALLGLYLVYLTSFWLMVVGVLILIFIWAYTAGPFPIAYKGWGDICVWFFFGPIPLCLTYYVQTGTLSTLSFLLSAAIGLLIVNILVVNNYRDYEQDKISNKLTTVVRFGRRFGLVLYLCNVIVALGCTLSLMLALRDGLLLIILCFGSCLLAWLHMRKREGTSLNGTLAHTSLNVLWYTLTVSLLLCAQVL